MNDQSPRLEPLTALHRDASVLAVVPHFACEEWLATCLASLTAQTRSLDRIVVVDDASTPPPTDVVAAFPDVTLLTASSNVGPYRLVQQIIEMTDYDAYLFQDADDWSAPDRLERLLAAGEESGAELVGSDYVMLQCDRASAWVQGFPEDVNAALAAAPTSHALQHPTSLVARSLVERIGGFASGMRFSGDAEFLRRAALTARVINVTRPLYFRRNRSDSLTTSSTTGHGTPARKAVLDALAERARENVAAVARGESPLLEPFSRRDPVRLTHLSGPLLGQRRAAVWPAPSIKRHDHRHHQEPAAPVFVIGASASTTDAITWSLAQHPDIAAVPDSMWITPLAAAAEAAEAMGGTGRPTPGTGRRIGALDAVGVTRADLLDALAATVRNLVAEGAALWVASLPADARAVGAAAALFPDARLLHVVRRVDDVTETADEWLSATTTCLEAEARFGRQRVLRVDFHDFIERPEAELRSCLSFLRVDFDDRCTWPLRSFEATSDARPINATDTAAAEALTLSAALCGPRAAVLDQARWITPPSPPSTTPAPAPAPPPIASHGSAPRALLRAAVPPGAVVAVISKGDERLVDLGHATGWHFPRQQDGTWTGFHPATGEEAIDHLTELQRQGAGYLFVPAWALWWLDHYDDLRAHLEAIGHLAAASSQGGILLQLDTTKRTTDRLDLAGLVPEDQRVGAASRATPPAHVDVAALAERPMPRVRHHGRKVAVISWSVSHNPLGRAYLLAEMLGRRYDVELLGARFDHFGGGIWPPLRDAAVPIRSFEGGSFPEHLWRMEDLVAELDADVIVACKPRLPSLGLGILAKAARNRPLILDIDDHELAFVKADAGVSFEHLVQHSSSPALHNPFGRLWTQYCDTLIGHVDRVLVSNATLQGRYGGTVIPHARDGALFDPQRFERARCRAEYGFGADERIVLFAGTPRRHKGIAQILEALAQLGDPRNQLCVIGTDEYEEMRAELAPFERWLRVVPYLPFDQLPRLLAASDAVCVVQDPTDPVSHYQIPAKATDALAMGVPCIVTPVAPLAEAIAAGAVETNDGESLATTLGRVLGDQDVARGLAERGRRYFLEHLSYDAVLPTLVDVIDDAIQHPRPMPAAFDELLEFQRATFGGRPTTTALRAVADPNEDAPVAAPPSSWRAAAPVATAPASRGRTRGEPSFDVAMFWKQNDTGIYGRRHDMLLAELVASPRIGDIVQFDAPVDYGTLSVALLPDIPTQDRLVRERMIERFRGVSAAPGLTQFTYGYTDDGGRGWVARYVEYVRSAIAMQCTSGRPLVFWTYPKNFELPQLIHGIEPHLVLVDIVDDHRSWARPGSDRWQLIDRHYAEIVALSDVALANCSSMAQAMGHLGRPIHVVPNGCEYPAALQDRSVPDDLAALPRPIIGYLGNLSSRLDLALLERLAVEFPAASLVLVGSAHAGTDVLALRRFDNVHFPGPRPYEEAKRYAHAFDVGIIPHVDDAMTRAMNPLKAFVYAALGIPVVSTDIANLDEMGDLITIARDHDAFVGSVRRALETGRAPHTPEQRARLEANTWSRRLDDILALLDAASASSHEMAGVAQ